MYAFTRIWSLVSMILTKYFISHIFYKFLHFACYVLAFWLYQQRTYDVEVHVKAEERECTLNCEQAVASPDNTRAHRGVYSREGSNNITIINSDFYNLTGSYALNFDNTDSFTIENCKIYNNSVSPILYLDKCDDAIISSCEVYVNEGTGVSMGGWKRVVIKDYLIYNNQGNGLYASYSEYVITENCARAL